MNEAEENEIGETKQKRMEQQQKEWEERQQLEQMLSQLLEPAAKQRLNNVRLANPNLHAKASQTILSLYQERVITAKLTENQLKAILEKLSPKRETIIRRK